MRICPLRFTTGSASTSPQTTKCHGLAVDVKLVPVYQHFRFAWRLPVGGRYMKMRGGVDGRGTYFPPTYNITVVRERYDGGGEMPGEMPAGYTDNHNATADDLYLQYLAGHIHNPYGSSTGNQNDSEFDAIDSESSSESDDVESDSQSSAHALLHHNDNWGFLTDLGSISGVKTFTSRENTKLLERKLQWEREAEEVGWGQSEKIKWEAARQVIESQSMSMKVSNGRCNVTVSPGSTTGTDIVNSTNFALGVEVAVDSAGNARSTEPIHGDEDLICGNSGKSDTSSTNENLHSQRNQNGTPNRRSSRGRTGRALTYDSPTLFAPPAHQEHLRSLPYGQQTIIYHDFREQVPFGKYTKVWIPADSERVLDGLYGPDWRTTARQHGGNGFGDGFYAPEYVRVPEGEDSKAFFRGVIVKPEGPLKESFWED